MAIRDSCPRVKKRTTYTKKNVTESKAGRQRSPKQDLVSMSSSDVGFLRGKRVTDDLRHICRQKHPKKIEGTKIVINFPPMHLSSKCHFPLKIPTEYYMPLRRFGALKKMGPGDWEEGHRRREGSPSDPWIGVMKPLPDMNPTCLRKPMKQEN